jgi:predicted O-linked N-acetylglucosamine transferase (SPINDLY family)
VAPRVQVGYKNYVGSMGAAFQAWIAADRVVAPPDYALVWH